MQSVSTSFTARPTVGILDFLWVSFVVLFCFIFFWGGLHGLTTVRSFHRLIRCMCFFHFFSPGEPKGDGFVRNNCAKPWCRHRPRKPEFHKYADYQNPKCCEHTWGYLSISEHPAPDAMMSSLESLELLRGDMPGWYSLVRLEPTFVVAADRWNDHFGRPFLRKGTNFAKSLW